MATKIKVETDNSNSQAPTTRNKRKPISEEQRAAAAARLEKAREKRKEKNPDYGQSGIHPTLRNLPDDHPISVKKVKEWIKTQKDIMSVERAAERQGIKGSISKWKNAEAYVRDMQKYLRDGDWISMFYGEHEQHKVKYKCVAMAYHDDGTPKRNVGTWYPDIGTYTQEMFNEDKELADGRKRKRPDNKRPVEGSPKGKKSKRPKSKRKRRTSTKKSR